MSEKSKKVCKECSRELEMNSYFFKPNSGARDGYNKKCRECSTNKKVFTEKGFKICGCCQEKLPMNSDYFFNNKLSYDKLNTKCKKCEGYEYSNSLTKIPKDGYKFCKKCDKELRNTASYFPVDKDCVDGLRSVCRKCGRDGRYFKEDYQYVEKFSKEELKIFEDRYPYYTNSELIEIFYPNETQKSLYDRAFRLGVVKSEETTRRRYLIHSENMSGENAPHYGKKFSEETRRKISEHAKKNGFKIGEYAKNRVWTQEQRDYLSKLKIKNKSWVGSNNPNWQDGVSSETKLARNSRDYKHWRRLVLERDGNECQRCSSSEKLEAHHLNPFNVNKDLRYDIDNGVTLCEKCHSVKHKNSFHNIYGTVNNTSEQFYEYMTGVSWCIDSKGLEDDKNNV